MSERESGKLKIARERERDSERKEDRWLKRVLER